jgi:hypothetical protein
MFRHLAQLFSAKPGTNAAILGSDLSQTAHVFTGAKPAPQLPPRPYRALRKISPIQD